MADIGLIFFDVYNICTSNSITAENVSFLKSYHTLLFNQQENDANIFIPVHVSSHNTIHCRDYMIVLCLV